MIFAANFKTNHTRATTREYIETLSSMIEQSSSDHEVFVFPPSTALDSFDTSIVIGTQNGYMAQNGAFTGEIGLEQLEEFSIKSILIGHSERREVLGETQEVVAKKFDFFKKHRFRIIYCIGEPLEIREQGDQAVMEYLLAQFDGIDIEYGDMILAYEPIWAIGTGRSATVEEIASTHKALRATISRPILYGGSAKPANIKEIISIDNVDGVLVGSASLDAKNFYTMITA